MEHAQVFNHPDAGWKELNGSRTLNQAGSRTLYQAGSHTPNEAARPPHTHATVFPRPPDSQRCGRCGVHFFGLFVPE